MASLSDSLSRLSEVHAGMDIYEVVTSERINALQDAVRLLASGDNIRAGANVRRTTGPGWVMISASPQGASAGASTVVLQPFDILLTTDAATGVTTFVLVPGAFNGLIPDNMFTTFTFSGELTFVVLKAAGDGELITGCTISPQAVDAAVQVPAPFSLPAAVEVLAEIIVPPAAVTDPVTPPKAYRILPPGHVSLSGAQQYVIDKDPPAEPGVLPYIPYYAWR